MNNKVLVEIIIPEIERRYNVLLPVNKRVGNVIVLLNKAISELDENHKKTNNSLYNSETGVKYAVESLIYNTDIRNGTALILI